MKLIHSALSRVTGVLLLAGAILVPYPGHAQTNLVVLARDGAWTWYNDPRALFHNGTLYFGYVRHGDGRTVLSAFNPRTATTTDLWTSTLTERDDHNVPVLLVRNDGRMLALYARHNTDLFFNYRLSTSTSPDTPEQWGPEQRSADTAARMTYANPVQLSGESNLIYNFARNLNFNPTVFTSRDGGATWSEPMIYFRSGSGSVRPYVKIASDGRRRIDFLYTDGHPRDVTNSLYHLYYESGVFRKTDGTAVGYFTNLPLDLDRGVSGSVIYQYSTEPQPDWNQWIPRGRAWCWEIVNGTGGPVCVFTVRLQGVAG
ncbi:MAG TPA: BNR-4 repeat-containing protein, partial [Verrucomicrobiota bacterium]|nr:BNR-4 repeat-containing protein [Verrucomicrobiota bacterium]